MSCYQNNGRNSRRGNALVNSAPTYRPYSQPAATMPAQNSMVDVATGRGLAGQVGVSGTDAPLDGTAAFWPVQPLPDTAGNGAMPLPEQLPDSAATLPGTLPIVPQPMPTPESEMPETLTEYIYTPGFLRAHIGSLMRVEFLVANNTTDRVGILREVGASYIVLSALETGSRIMCDLFSIKFVTIIDNQLEEAFSGF